MAYKTFIITASLDLGPKMAFLRRTAVCFALLALLGRVTEVAKHQKDAHLHGDNNA
jgi:hypothetical protein